LSVDKYYEITCDWCSGAEHFTGTVKKAVKEAMKAGWIVKDGRHFDTMDCMEAEQKERRERV